MTEKYKPINDDLLDDEMTIEKAKSSNFELSEQDIVKASARLIINNKSKIHSKEEAMKLIYEAYTVNEGMMKAIFDSLTKSMKRALAIGGIIFFLFCFGLVLIAATNGDYGFTPGIIFIILAIINLNTGFKLKRILDN